MKKYQNAKFKFATAQICFVFFFFSSDKFEFKFWFVCSFASPSISYAYIFVFYLENATPRHRVRSACTMHAIHMHSLFVNSIKATICLEIKCFDKTLSIANECTILFLSDIWFKYTYMCMCETNSRRSNIVNVCGKKFYWAFCVVYH